MTDPDINIIRSLLENEEEFLSGNKLAGKLGISRVGVWARLEKMREQGFEFEAVRHRGYRLIKDPEQINPTMVSALLTPGDQEVSLVFSPETDSTNSDAERCLANGMQVPLVVLANKQTKGRGRLGRIWHSPDEGNSYMSFVFRPQLHPREMQSFTVWMGLKFCQFLSQYTHLPFMLKWPNDIILADKKAGGILTEARIDADRTRDLILGMGLNVNSDTGEWPEEVARVSTSMAGESGKKIPINRLVAGLIDTGISAYDQYLKGAYQDELKLLWTRFDWLHGKRIQAQPGNSAISGVANGIDLEGRLQLLRDDGQQISLNSGEVSLGTGSLI